MYNIDMTNKTALIAIRLDPDLKDKLKKEADKAKMSMSQYIRILLEEKINEGT